MWCQGWGWGKDSSQCIDTLSSYAIDSLWPFSNKEVDGFFTEILRYYKHIFKINLHLEIIGFGKLLMPHSALLAQPVHLHPP